MTAPLGSPSVRLPFPPAALSGHATYGGGRKKARITKELRRSAWAMAKAANLKAPPEGEVRLVVTLVPPNDRGDRTNYPARCKPYIDGIADALGTDRRPFNDKRFIPVWDYQPVQKPGWVTFRLEPVS